MIKAREALRTKKGNEAERNRLKLFLLSNKTAFVRLNQESGKATGVSEGTTKGEGRNEAMAKKQKTV